jgi:RNA polymerase sigma-70 factor (ECF subfamily)
MERYRAGDRQAFRALFDRYAPRLTRAVGRHVRTEQDVVEIVQQTFLHVHRARHDYRSGTPLRPWIFTICMNLKRELFRRRARRPEAPLELDGRTDPSEAAYDPLRAERDRHVRQAVDALPAAQREVIELHWFEGMPFGEVAEVVGASVTAVKVRAHRGYERLRAALADEECNQIGPTRVQESE